jgi:hypothetical protein
VKAESILEAVLDVTKSWAKVRKDEERHRDRLWRRREMLVRPPRETIKDVAWAVMAGAYAKASAGGTLPAHARQIMYAARGEIQERTGRTLDDQYFCQTLLPDYMTEHPETAGWDVVFDARGHFAEPHTKRIVPLGTLDVRRYLGDIDDHTVEDPELQISGQDGRYPTRGPRHRFGAILFIEKEGFMPLFERVHLAERYDLAVMSTKGLSVTASRQLVDELWTIPLLILHDFDKAGFSILQTLHQDTRRYEFTNALDVIDLGLRLADVEAQHLQAEAVGYGTSDPRGNLRDNGATAEEIQFLCATTDVRGYAGQRVELNAFPSDQLVAWIESKLRQQGVKKVVPSETILRAAYRRALQVELFRARAEAMAEEVREAAEAAKVPRRLRQIVQKRLKANPEAPWDQAITDLAQLREVSRLGRRGRRRPERG